MSIKTIFNKVLGRAPTPADQTVEPNEVDDVPQSQSNDPVAAQNAAPQGMEEANEHAEPPPPPIEVVKPYEYPPPMPSLGIGSDLRRQVGQTTEMQNRLKDLEKRLEQATDEERPGIVMAIGSLKSELERRQSPELS